MKNQPIGSVRTTLATWVTTALLVVLSLPVALAGSRAAPEIVDAENDVSPASFAANTPQNASLFGNLTMYDVVRAWIDLETQDDFWLFIEVKDLPDGWGLPASPPGESPFGTNASFAGTSLVANFSIASHTYRAIFKFHMPEPGSLMDNYTVWRADGGWAAVPGAYNTTQDWVAMRLPKELFPGLVDGARLQNFWTLGRHGNLSMDFAPNARDPATGSLDPLNLARKLAAGESVATPMYGSSYTFGQYYHPPGSPGYSPNAPVPNIALVVVGDDTRLIERGTTTTYEVRVENRGASDDRIFLSLGSAPDGWSHQLSSVEVQLAPGAARSILLTVSAAPTASQPLRSLVEASSHLGGTASAGFLTVLAAPTQSPSPTTSEPIDDDVEDADGGGAPGFGVVLVLGALAGVLAARRRR